MRSTPPNETGLNINELTGEKLSIFQISCMDPDTTILENRLHLRLDQKSSNIKKTIHMKYTDDISLAIKTSHLQFIGLRFPSLKYLKTASYNTFILE
jgi:hypothetical protein